MRKVAKLLLALASFGVAAVLTVKFVLPAIQGTGRPTAVPHSPAAPTLPHDLRQRIALATDLEVPELLREAADRYAGQVAAAEVTALLHARSGAMQVALETEVDGLLSSFQYADAAALLKRYARAWRGTGAATVIAAQLDELRSEQTDQVAARLGDAAELFDLGRYQAAREALATGWQFEAPFRQQLTAEAKRLERRIRVALSSPGTPVTIERPGAAPVVRHGRPSPPPALPGYPHPDVKRLKEARVLMTRARGLFAKGRHQPASDALLDLVGSYGDLGYIKRNREALAAMTLLARRGVKGLTGLFHATEVKRRGSRIRLVYRFRSEDEFFDWETFKTIPTKESGQFDPARDGVRGTGATSYIHYAFFRNDVKMSCISRSQQPRTHGLSFCQQGLESRQIDLLVTNHWFVEGENYVKARPGHSLLLIGKGSNADVPVDSPEVGFIFKGPSNPGPIPPPGGELRLSFTFRGKRMMGTVSYKDVTSTLNQEAIGDDGRSVERVRPALFVIQAGVLFKDIVIEGVLHRDFENVRVAQLLDLASDIG